MAKQMNTKKANPIETLDQAATQPAGTELIPLTALPLVNFLTKKGEERVGVRLHSLSYLPERVTEDGPQSARFGGFLGEWTDPATGVVRGLNRDSIPLQFFGKAAEQLRGIIDTLVDPKRDAVILACNGDPATLMASVHRNEDGSVRQLAVGTREFRGNFKKLIAAPEAVVEEE
jgi:hypothetical protein